MMNLALRLLFVITGLCFYSCTGHSRGCSSNAECGSTSVCIHAFCADPCEVIGCGPNTECNAVDHKAQCFCLPGYTQAGSKQCSENSNCPSKEACLEGVCADPCKDADCGGPNSMCEVIDQAAKCTCVPGFVLGEKGCKLQDGSIPCFENSNCPSKEACLELVCADPCKDTDCGGPNTMCEVIDHAAKCTCKTGFELGEKGCKLQESPVKDVKSGNMTCYPKPKAWVKWVHWEDGVMMAYMGKLVIGGLDHDYMYVGRAHYKGALVPGKLFPWKGLYFTWSGVEEVNDHDFEILAGEHLAWVPSENGKVPPNAVVGGITTDKETLYIGRAHHKGSLTCGRVQPSHGVLNIPYGGWSVNFEKYEVLVME